MYSTSDLIPSFQNAPLVLVLKILKDSKTEVYENLHLKEKPGAGGEPGLHKECESWSNGVLSISQESGSDKTEFRLW